jgi:predicted ATPase
MRDEQTNVRDAPSSFVGRATDIAELSERFDRGARLVTVTGPGGMGKTRLAVRFAQARLQAYCAHGGGGVWFCDLTEARTLTGMAAVIAGVLRARLPDSVTDATAAADLGPVIARRGRTLLVLDNFEHLVSVGGAALDLWLTAAPRAHLLVTSRLALGRPGEQLWPLQPLPDEDAVDLFLRRTEQVRPDLRPSDADVALVSAIVRSLEGMPLAIELAASRMAILSPAQLHARLDRPLDLLADRGPGAGRHTSVRRTVLDSVRLLRPADRDAFAACAVFRSGFTLEAGEAVVGRPEAMDSIEALTRHSLLRVLPAGGPGGELRFSFFDTVREVASELLADSPERDDVATRHAAFFAGLARDLGPTAAIRSGGPEALRMERETMNLLAAHAHTIALAGRTSDEAAAHQAVAIAVGLDPLLSARGLSRLRLRLLDEALGAATTARADPRRPEIVEACLARGLALRELGAMDGAREALEEGLRRAARAHLPALEAVAHARIGEIIEIAGGTAEAHVRFERALGILASSPDDAARASREADILLRDGHAHRREGALDRAEAAVAEAVVRYRRLNHDEGLAAAMYEAAVVAMFQGRSDVALERFDEGLRVARGADVRAVAGALVTARGGLLQEMGRVDEALAHHAEAARVFRELGSRYRETSALYYQATAYLERGDARDAERVLAQASERVRGLGSPRYEALIEGCRALVFGRHGDLAAAEQAMQRARAAASACATEGALAATVAVHAMTLEVCRSAEPDSNEAPHARKRTEPGSNEAPARVLVEAHPSDDSRFALRMLTAALHPPRARTSPALAVWRGARAFQPPSAPEKVELVRRAPLRRILELLVDRRLDAPGEAVAVEDIVSAGWPGERIQVQAALNRAYVALTTLRKLGLRDVLVTGTGGYWLHPAIPLERVEDEDTH